MQAIEKDIEENQRYKLKLLKRIEPLEDELKVIESNFEGDSMSIMSTSEHQLRGNDTRASKDDLSPGNLKPKEDLPPLSQNVIPIYEQNYILKELNEMYSGKLEILKSSFYDKETLEHALQRYINSDCIEYKEYAIEAYEILSLHEKLLEITLAEKQLMQQIELSDNMKNLPYLQKLAMSKESELKELKTILARQIKVISSQVGY